MSHALPCPFAVTTGQTCGVCKWCRQSQKEAGLVVEERDMLLDLTKEVGRHLSEMEAGNELRLAEAVDGPARIVFDRGGNPDLTIDIESGASVGPGVIRRVTEIDLN